MTRQDCALVCLLFVLPATALAERFDGTIEIPDSEVTITLGGYIKLDMIHDFDAIGSTDTFDPSTIPTDGSEGENTRFHARQSRFRLGIERPTRWGPAQMVVETDFFGSGSNLRLRHAYVEVGPLLAGQTWTTFMDESSFPPTIDFAEPRAFLLARHALIRWTWRPSERLLLAVALEEPDAEVDPGENAVGSFEDSYPDFATRFRRTGDFGHVQVSGFAGRPGFRFDDGKDEDETIWGLALSGNLAVGARDRFRFQVAHGDGLARYRSGVAVATDAEGRLEAIPATSLMLSYQHYWSDELSSTIIYSPAGGDNTAGQGPDAIESVDYSAVNLIWDFAEGFTVGAEWLYGTRNDKDGASGEANRLHIGFKFDFF